MLVKLNMDRISFTVTAYRKKFVFEKENGFAFYDFDHMKSKNGDASLEIDANREVYAFYSNNGKRIQGVIKDLENNILLDNFGVEDKGEYHFVRCKKQGYFI